MSISYSVVQGGCTPANDCSYYDINVDADPLVTDPASGDYTLSVGSPCIDSGNGDVAPSTDMLNQTRIDDPSTPDTGVGTPTYVDLGAYEFHP
ncbi:MAG: hypothetical protein GY854_29735 [Deltaproteobacteria bacterium]|nr:hypothetical protein [Deltaproteobacteria bacterium]